MPIIALSFEWGHMCVNVSQFTATQLFVQKFVLTNLEITVAAPHYWLFVRVIYWWLVDSPHKLPAMWRVFPIKTSSWYQSMWIFNVRDISSNWQSGWLINSLDPSWCASNFTSMNYKLIKQIDILSISCERGLRWMPQNTFDDKSTWFR